MTGIRNRAARNGMGDALRRVAARNAAKTAFIWQDRSWSFAELETAAFRVAENLAALGLQKGDRVAAFGRNSDSYMLLWLACLQSGLIHVPANFGLTGGELRYIIEQSGSRAIIVDAALAGHLPHLDGLTALEFTGCFDGDIGSIDILRAAQDSSKEPRREWDVGTDDFCQIMYTSGTTGLPKGGLMTHAALLAEYTSCITSLDMVEGDIVLEALPLYHAGQLHCFTMPHLFTGSTAILLEQPKPDLVFSMIETHAITTFFAPPTSWVTLLRDPAFDRYDLSSLQKIYYGASIMPEPILAELRARLPGVRTYNCYGQSETGPLATVLRPEDHDGRLTSAGKPVINMETRVVDEAMNDTPPGVAGEIVHRSPQLITCYWDKPQETADAFAGGWFHSGDMGYFDEEGFIYVVDRLKDVVKSGGVMVATREVEDVLFKHESVYEVAVVGLSDPKWIEAVTAIVVRREGFDTPEDELIGYAKEHLAYYKVPKRIVFTDALPRNASGKILKRELRLMFGGTEAAFKTGGD